MTVRNLSYVQLATDRFAGSGGPRTGDRGTILEVFDDHHSGREAYEIHFTRADGVDWASVVANESDFVVLVSGGPPRELP